jgi:threonine dehydratase
VTGEPVVEPLTAEVALGDVADANGRLASFLDRTPVIRSRAISGIADRPVWLKCENLQVTGSFKVRGALNALLRMPPATRGHGIVTESSGNFGLGLAWAALQLGVRVSVVMPSDAAAMKRDAAGALGADVRLCAPSLADRTRVVEEIVHSTGAVFLSSHDDLDVIAGQGTVALEMTEQASAPESVIVPVGGGGLISGVATVVKAVWPEVRVIGVQPSGAADAARSKEAGRRIGEEEPRSLATGLLVNLGLKNWAIVDALVDDVVVVDDLEIVAAVRLLWEQMRLLVEPSAAVTIAALTSPDLRSRMGSGSTLVVLSGGNIDLDNIPWTRSSSTAAQQPKSERRH